MITNLPLFGFCAYSGTGKTTLIKQLLPLLKQRGLRVAVIKHTHHVIDLDKPGKDSYEIREAGADQVILASHKRVISTHELDGSQQEASLADAMLSLSADNTDLILVEGFKHESFPKIELHRPSLNKPLLYPDDPQIIAVITDDDSLALPKHLTRLNLNQPDEIIQYLLDEKDNNTHKNIASQNTIQHTPSCADARDPNSLSFHQALDNILNSITPVELTTHVPLRSALGKVLAKDIISPINVPNHTNSAMDGYALRGDDLPSDGIQEYKIIGTAFAGNQQFDQTCQKQECIRIMTGAPMPAGTDTVVMQEQTEVTNTGLVKIGTGHKPQQNVRQAGEDISIDQTVLPAGRQLTAADIGIIGSLGIGEVEVSRPLRVAFFSTGDELRSIGEPLAHGQVYDSNRYSLHALLQKFQVEILDLGVVRDDLTALEKTLKTASQSADVIITSGGVSVGEADFIKTALNNTGEINFWKIAIKPGRPLAFGTLGNAHFFGLPGNPVAVMITFLQFVQPALMKLSGQTHHAPILFDAICTTPIKKKPGRTEFQRGILKQNNNGCLTVEKSDHQGSGILTSMSRSNCLIILDEEASSVKEDSLVKVQLI